jgi:ribosomal protein L11 methylase PrmA
MKTINFMHLAKRLIPVPVKRFIKELIQELPWNKLRTEINDLKAQLQQNEEMLLYEMKALPLPPKHLQVRVVGGYFGDFIWSGYRTFNVMEEMLEAKVKKSLRDFNTILDFGCGCGRIIRALKHIHPSWTLYGSDIDAEAITCSNRDLI